MSLRISLKECIPGPSHEAVEDSFERKVCSSERAVVFPSPQCILGRGLISGKERFDALSEHKLCSTKSKDGPREIFLGILRSAIREDLSDSRVWWRVLSKAKPILLSMDMCCLLLFSLEYIVRTFGGPPLETGRGSIAWSTK